MLVVDHRNKEECAYFPGENYALAQEKTRLLLDVDHRPVESIVVPAQVEIDIGGELEDAIAVVVQTPGKDALVELLFKRVWGVVSQRTSGNW